MAALWPLRLRTTDNHTHSPPATRDGVKARRVKAKAMTIDAKAKTKDFGSEAKTKAKDLSFKAEAKVKADNCWPRGTSRSRPRPRGLHLHQLRRPFNT